MPQHDRARIATTLLLAALASSAACVDSPSDALDEASAELSASNAADRAQLALRWAPVHYQDVDQTGSHALGGAADYIAAYDFDGNLNGRDNWDHAGNAAFPLRATGGDGAIGCDTNAANAPWGWNDHDDAPPRGALAIDPAGLVRAYFTTPETVSTTYTFNPFH